MRFESVRSRQSIGLGLERPGLTMNYDDICETPCTLYLPPGPATVYAEGIGIEPTATEFAIPTHPLRLRLHAPRASAVLFGRTATLLGVGVGAVGLVLTILGATDASHGSVGAGTVGLLVSGGVALGVGAGLIIPGLVVLSRIQTGIESHAPLETGATRTPNLGFTLVF